MLIVAEKKKGIIVKKGSVFSIRSDYSDSDEYSLFYYLVDGVCLSASEITIRTIGRIAFNSSNKILDSEPLDTSGSVIKGRFGGEGRVIIPPTDKNGYRRSLVDLNSSSNHRELIIEFISRVNIKN